MLKILCNDLAVGLLPSRRDDVASRMKDTATESRDLRIESEEDGDDHNRDDAHAPLPNSQDDSGECQQTSEESKLSRVLVGELADDEVVIYGPHGDSESLALWNRQEWV
jgi:hypothetical protein